MNDELITPKALAEEWGTNEAGLAQQRYRGNGPRFIKANGRMVRYRRSDINAYLDAQTRQRTGDQAASA